MRRNIGLLIVLTLVTIIRDKIQLSKAKADDLSAIEIQSELKTRDMDYSAAKPILPKESKVPKEK